MMAATLKRSADLFRYTSGRWIYNESKRLQERFLRFNVSELTNAAARSVDRRPEDVISFVKLAEGGFNRTFELTMRDGFQLIAKLPYPTTQPKRLAVASEVATMDLVRRHGVPTPAIYGYSAREDNAVGSEYILMEKIAAKSLEDVWCTLSATQRKTLLSSIAENEAKLFAIELPASGSVYFESDLPSSAGRVPLSQNAWPKSMCIGPSCHSTFWFGDRSLLDIPREPALSPVDALSAPARKEVAWTRQYGTLRFPSDRHYRELSQYRKSDPAEHCRSLKWFLKHASHLVPKVSALVRPVLCHPTLTLSNIFVSDDCKVVSFIDWQHSEALPLFLQAGIPLDFQNYGDPVSEELAVPKLPDLTDLDADEQELAQQLYRRRHTHFCYVGATATLNRTHFDALAEPGEMLRRRIFQRAGVPWDGNNIPLQADIIQMLQQWADLAPGSASSAPSLKPLTSDEADIERILHASQKQQELDWRMDMLRSFIGIRCDGWVSEECHAAAVAKVAAIKAEAVDMEETEFDKEMLLRHWPFDDQDESE